MSHNNKLQTYNTDLFLNPQMLCQQLELTVPISLSLFLSVKRLSLSHTLSVQLFGLGVFSELWSSALFEYFIFDRPTLFSIGFEPGLALKKQRSHASDHSTDKLIPFVFLFILFLQGTVLTTRQSYQWNLSNHYVP